MIKGHSGADIEIINCDNFLRICKHSDDNQRLQIQKNKQIDFFNKIQSNNYLSFFYTTPKVFEDDKFIMEYVNGNDILDLIEFGKTLDLDRVISLIILFLDWEFENCKTVLIQSNIFLEKINSIKCEMINIEVLKNHALDFHLPVGFCHGDLTFANMIFTDKIVFIDFLDCFVESPIQDVCKIFQEINLKWSLLMSNQNRNNAKIHIGYDYLKKKLNCEIMKNLKRWKVDPIALNVLYSITILRLLPYIKDEFIYRKVENELKTSMEKIR